METAGQTGDGWERGGEFYNGILVKGGDVEKLTPSGHVVENCHVHDAARGNRNGAKSGIEVGEAGAGRLRGVACRVSHCLIHDLPMFAVRFSGNDNVKHAPGPPSPGATQTRSPPC